MHGVWAMTIDRMTTVATEDRGATEFPQHSNISPFLFAL